MLKPTAVLAFAVAAVVHGATLALVLLGVALSWITRFHPAAVAGCAILLGIAWAMRPRVSETPKAVLPREKAPALYGIAEEVAQALGMSGIDGIVIGSGFNAAFNLVGWRRKKVLFIGLPLWQVLEDGEKVALIAHELAHGVNGDPNRGLFVGTAIETLVRWHHVMDPRRLWEQGVWNLYQFVAIAVLCVPMFGLSSVAYGGAYVLSHLLWRDTQRAEYLADYLAAQVSGTPAMLTMLDKLHYAHAFTYAVRKVTSKWSDGNIFDEFAQQIAQIPEREMERIRRLEQLEMSRLDASHPPTAYRSAFLRAHGAARPAVALSTAHVEQADRELEPFKHAIQKRIVAMRMNA